MLYSDGNGFPLTVKPSHLFGSTERMDTAEVLSAIVDEACRYVPENVEKPKRLTRVEIKEARTSGEDKEALTSGDEKEALTRVKKVPVVASNLVRFTSF